MLFSTHRLSNDKILNEERKVGLTMFQIQVGYT